MTPTGYLTTPLSVGKRMSLELASHSSYDAYRKFEILTSPVFVPDKVKIGRKNVVFGMGLSL